MNMTITRLIAARVSHPVSAERDVEVVAQESGKRDMPAPPEIGKANGGVGKPEIIFEMEAEAKGRTDRAGGIAGEIEKDLAGESHHAQPGIKRDERPAVAKNSVGRTGEHGVGQNDLLEQSQSHERKPQRKRPSCGSAAAPVAAENRPLERSVPRPAAGRKRRRGRNRAAISSAASRRDRCRACRRANETCRTRCRPAGGCRGAAVGK